MFGGALVCIFTIESKIQFLLGGEGLGFSVFISHFLLSNAGFWTGQRSVFGSEISAGNEIMS